MLRYLAKVTTEPARVHGIADEVGRLAPGRVADVVLWEAGRVRRQARDGLQGAASWAWGALGEGNARVEVAEPRRYGPTGGRRARGRERSHHVRVRGRRSTAASPRGSGPGAAWSRSTGPARSGATTSHRNTAVAGRSRSTPPEGTVTLDGRVLRTDPVTDVPLSRRYLLA